DMADLALEMKRLGYRLEQIQDFTPTPMTLSTEMYYTGIDPETMRPVYVAVRPDEKKQQNDLFFFYKKELQGSIRHHLQQAGLSSYIARLFPSNPKKR
ncbi:MAG: DUF3362 domain-containing protein, partial [Bacteroidales bacterium]|nr:DUF3362 domain-containing protein [Bacteroidales bacterium]